MCKRPIIVLHNNFEDKMFDKILYNKNVFICSLGLELNRLLIIELNFAQQ